MCEGHAPAEIALPLRDALARGAPEARPGGGAVGGHGEPAAPTPVARDATEQSRGGGALKAQRREGTNIGRQPPLDPPEHRRLGEDDEMTAWYHAWSPIAAYISNLRSTNSFPRRPRAGAGLSGE